MNPATHVLIRGHVFTYAEKSPFVASGMSVLGALEYDEAADRLKCHECGMWVRGLGNHVRTHGMKRREYNRKHGMSASRALCTPGRSSKSSRNAN